MLQPVDRMPTAPPLPPMTVADARAADAVKGMAFGGSGGYVFSPEEIDAVIAQWKQLLEEIEDDEREAIQIANVEAPGLEFASGDFQSAAGPSGEMLMEQIGRMRRYVADYITALQDARNATGAQDEQSATEVRDAAGEIA